MPTLPKSERLSGRAAISALMTKGRWGFTRCLKYCYLIPSRPAEEDESTLPNRIMVSVPKRLFKRAVKRNLLKRRLREAYRLQKEILPPSGVSVMFLYNTADLLDFGEIHHQVGSALKRISDERQL